MEGKSGVERREGWKKDGWMDEMDGWMDGWMEW